LTRSSAGAHFLQTQLCFNPAMLQVYMQRLVAARITWRYAVMVSLAPLPSAATARWLRENHRSVLIPDSLVKQLETAPDPVQEGIAVCAQLMREFAAIPGVSGFHLHTLENPAAVVAAIAASGLRTTAVACTGQPASG
jgi:methylenetetrahydrofolate reductase (NADPH)